MVKAESVSKVFGKVNWEDPCTFGSITVRLRGVGSVLLAEESAVYRKVK